MLNMLLPPVPSALAKSHAAQVRPCWLRISEGRGLFVPGVLSDVIVVRRLKSSKLPSDMETGRLDWWQ